MFVVVALSQGTHASMTQGEKISEFSQSMNDKEGLKLLKNDPSGLLKPVEERIALGASVEDVSGSAEAFGRSDELPDRLNVWPAVQVQTPSEDTQVLVSHDMIIVAPSHYCEDILSPAMSRASKLAMSGYPGLAAYKPWRYYQPEPAYKSTSPLLNVLEVYVPKEGCVDLAVGVDESYELEIATPTSTLTANTVWGALRGLETFSQLVEWDGHTHVVRRAPLTIKDWPEYSWRGLMVDTSRHFIPVSILKKTIDAMSYNKLNVFHWHITDSHSFPLLLNSQPDLVKGAFHPGAVYRHRDIEELVEWATARGVVIVPEIDTPGHAASWMLGRPDITVACWGVGRPGVFTLDPTLEETFVVIKDIFRELKGLFPSAIVHVGGDEVNKDCWASDPDVVYRAAAMNITDMIDLEVYHWKRVLDITEELELRAVGWEEMFAEGGVEEADTDRFIVHEWRASTNTVPASTAAGFDTIASSSFYLDVQSPGGSHYRWTDTWQDFYVADYAGGLSEEQRSHLIGAELCSWSENVNQFNIDNRIWQRGTAAAEVFWTAPAERNIPEARDRLARMNCRLSRRGLAVGPVKEGDFCDPLPAPLEGDVHKWRGWSLIFMMLSGALFATNIATLWGCLSLRSSRQEKAELGYATLDESEEVM